MAEEYELGTVGPIPTVNPNVAKIGEMLKLAKKYADQYYVKDYVPLIGGTTLGEFLLGKAPEEVERWGQGDSPFRNPKEVVRTGGNRLDVWKTGRFEPTFEVLANVALPVVGTGQMAARPIARTLGPKAAEMAEDYLTKQGAIANIVEPSPKKVVEPFSAIDELGFHSPLENAILKIQQPKGTGDQFLKQLEKTPGVKTEELDVTGIKQYLLDHPTVTKQELLDQMATSRLKLQQTVLGKGSNEDTYGDYQLRGGEVFDDDEYIRSLADDFHYDMKSDDVLRKQERDALLEADPERYADIDVNPYSQARLEEDIDGVLYEYAKAQANDMYYENPIRRYNDDYDYEIYGNDDMGYSFKSPSGEFLNLGGRNGIYDLGEAEDALRQHHFENGIVDIDGGGAKFEDYTLPGKYENYREVLTTLPEAKQQMFDPAKVEIVRNRQSATQGTYTIKYDGKEIQTYGDEFNAKDNYKGLSDDEIMQTAKNLYEKGNKFQQIKPMSGTFQSSHFDEPNILAHTRLNDRIINGKKTLMVEEIQSDWHQAGRRKGYDTPEVRQNIEKERQRLLEQKDYYAKLAEPYAAQGKDSPPDVIAGWTQAANGLQELQKVENNMSKAVPDAPFKKNWHELMMKQILNEAVNGGYDAVAFTTGKQQAARYNLAKQVNSIDWKPYNERGAEKIINIMPINGNLIELPIDANGKVIERAGGQFAGKSIDEIIGKEVAKKIMETPDGDLTGQGLEIGGEGMKGFYDKILPDYINKYGKKYGIGVKKAKLDPAQKSLTDEQVEESLKKLGYSMEDYYKIPMNERNPIWDKVIEMNNPGEEVHYFDLSDMAKKDIKEKGQPLFSGIGLAPAPLLFDEEDN
jgi:hypothetical protein